MSDFVQSDADFRSGHPGRCSCWKPNSNSTILGVVLVHQLTAPTSNSIMQDRSCLCSDSSSQQCGPGCAGDGPVLTA